MHPAWSHTVQGSSDAGERGEGGGTNTNSAFNLGNEKNGTPFPECSTWGLHNGLHIQTVFAELREEEGKWASYYAYK